MPGWEDTTYVRIDLIGVIAGTLVTGDGVMSMILDSCLMEVFKSGIELAIPDKLAETMTRFRDGDGTV